MKRLFGFLFGIMLLMISVAVNAASKSIIDTVPPIEQTVGQFVSQTSMQAEPVLIGIYNPPGIMANHIIYKSEIALPNEFGTALLIKRPGWYSELSFVYNTIKLAAGNNINAIGQYARLCQYNQFSCSSATLLQSMTTAYTTYKENYQSFRKS
jgi:hypothetical protein